MAGNPLASLPGLPQRPSLARSSASETRLTQPGIEGARSRKLNSAPTAAFRFIGARSRVEGERVDQQRRVGALEKWRGSRSEYDRIGPTDFEPRCLDRERQRVLVPARDCAKPGRPAAQP